MKIIKGYCQYRQLFWAIFSPYIISINDFTVDQSNPEFFINGMMFEYNIKDDIKRWLDENDIEYIERVKITPGPLNIFRLFKPKTKKKYFLGFAFKNYDDMVYAKIGYHSE